MLRSRADGALTARGRFAMTASVVSSQERLLADDEPAPVQILAAREGSPWVIACDHAGNLLPRALGSLGLSADELQRHIAWDIGAGNVARYLAEALGGFLALQSYSRLVIDCNRGLHVPTSIVEKSEYTVVPGNQALSVDERERRANEIFWPYHREIEREFQRRKDCGRSSVFVAIHSFTPRFMGAARAWHAGVLYGKDARLGRALLPLLRSNAALLVGDNEPYAVSDVSDYSVNEYGERRGNPYVELEIRQDLIADEEGQRRWAARLAQLLPAAYAEVERAASVG